MPAQRVLPPLDFVIDYIIMVFGFCPTSAIEINKFMNFLEFK